MGTDAVEGVQFSVRVADRVGVAVHFRLHYRARRKLRNGAHFDKCHKRRFYKLESAAGSGFTISRLSGVNTMVRTWPLDPMGPTAFPFHRMSRPPALPTFMRAASSPERVLVSPG